MATAQVIQLSDYIPRKPADNRIVAYRCIRCSMSTALPNNHGYAVDCSCGAEMHPVEAK